MLDRDRILTVFQKHLYETKLLLTPHQRDVLTIIANLASNADNLNNEDIDRLRLMTKKGYEEKAN